MKLQNLIDGSGQSEFILLHDNKNDRGELLLAEFIKQNVKLGNYTHLLCTEKHPVVLRNLPVANNFHCQFFPDWGSWIKTSSDLANNDDKDPFKSLLKIQNKVSSHPKVVIVIDSLAMLLILIPEKCYSGLHHLLNSGSGQKQQVVSLLHSDVVLGGQKAISTFEKLATSNVYIDQHDRQACATVKHRKSSGRILETVEYFSFDQSLKLITVEIQNQKIPKTDNSEEWMSKDVTFKLQLEDKEKQARSELVLPYLKASKNSVKTAEIYYEPDANDDWDEEDPDDDLDI